MNADPDHELVRVSREMVQQLIDDESDPVVVIGLKRMDDGTCDMRLRTSEQSAEVEHLRAGLVDLEEVVEYVRTFRDGETIAESIWTRFAPHPYETTDGTDES